MEIRDLDFANDASAMLSTVVDQFSRGFISQNDRRYWEKKNYEGTSEDEEQSKPTAVCVFDFFRFALKLLEDVVFFVADVLNSGQPVLDVVMSKPNRERQKLMREQNILKQVSGWTLMVTDGTTELYIQVPVHIVTDDN